MATPDPSKPSPTEPISPGDLQPAPPVSITPQEEAEQRQFSEKFAAGVAKGVELAAEAKRRGIPLHDLVPVN